MRRKIFLYCFKLLTFYFLFYYGTLLIIGFAAPGGYYLLFVEKYFNYPALLRSALLNTSKAITHLLGYQAEIFGQYKIRFINGVGVRIVYSCLGFGLISFWAAFIIANDTKFKFKILFIILGIFLIFSINVTRIVLLLIAVNKGAKLPFGIDHHTLFNVVAYLLILLMIYLFGRYEKRYIKHDENKISI